MILKVSLRSRQEFTCTGCGYSTISMPFHCPMCGTEFNELLITLSDGMTLPAIGLHPITTSPQGRRPVSSADTLDWT